VGWRVANQLAEEIPSSVARVLVLDRPGPALIEHLAGRQAALLIDAADTGETPGSIHRLDGAEIESVGGPWSSHGLRLVESLALGRVLGMLPARLDLYLVAIDPAQARAPDRPLTPPVARAARALTRHLAALLVAGRR
jgi:hydrogenase maturation protease